MALSNAERNKSLRQGISCKLLKIEEDLASSRDEIRASRDEIERLSILIYNVYLASSRDEMASSRDEMQSPVSLTKKEEDSKKKKETRLAARLALDWQPSDSDRAFAVKHDLDPDLTAEEFRDYWHAKPGAQATKLDWPATWRTWVRRAAASPSDQKRLKANGHEVSERRVPQGPPPKGLDYDEVRWQDERDWDRPKEA